MVHLQNRIIELCRLIIFSSLLFSFLFLGFLSKQTEDDFPFVSQITNSKTLNFQLSKKKPKALNWQEQRKCERERKQQQEDEQTLAKIEAPIPQSNIGFKMLKLMGYTPGSALGKEGSGRAEPVGLEIRRSRAGIGRHDPHKEKRKREEIEAEKGRKKEEALLEEFGCRQKSQWRSRRIVVNFEKAKRALDQLENKEVVEPEKNSDDEGEGEDEEEEEEITEEVMFLAIVLFGTIFCWFWGLCMKILSVMDIRVEFNCACY